MKKVTSSEKTRIDDYEFENEIGRGASGICFKGKKKDTGEVFAIKKILLNSLKVENLHYPRNLPLKKP